MKCICPMGGDRTCPDDCTHALLAHLSPAERNVKAKRQPISVAFHGKGYTQQQIAEWVGVSQRTISEDLRGLEVTSKPSRPKGGRPKGSKGGPKPERRTTTPAVERAAAVLVLDQGKTYDQVKDELGLRSVTTVKNAVAREEGRREPQVDRADLSLTAQQKFDAAIRQYQAKLDASFIERVRAEVQIRVQDHMNDVFIPRFKEQIAQAQKLFRHRRGAMEKETFNTIRRALHPDSRFSISDKKLAEAFDAFMALEKFLLDEKDSPTHFDTMPDNLAEWDVRRAQATAARKKQHANSGTVQRR